MKLRTWFFMAIGLIALISMISAWFQFSSRTQAPVPVFPATARSDCAPWDGAAFAIAIPIEGSLMYISIYQSADLKFPSAFSFPDETLREGNAYLLDPAGSPEQVTGRVWFKRVNRDRPVEGRFDLTSEGGGHFEGTFTAEWESQAVYCG